MKVSELTGSALDLAVAKCEGAEVKPNTHPFDKSLIIKWPNRASWDDFCDYSPSTDWSQGGPIIERAGISIDKIDAMHWAAVSGKRGWLYGDTPLIAAMRCYVSSKFGDEIEIPMELLKSARQEGRLLEIEPGIDSIAETHWDCWADDGNSNNPRYEWDDPRSIAIAYASLIQWAELLGIPYLHPEMMRKYSGMGERLINDVDHWYLTSGQHDDGYANVFCIVIDMIIDAGYSVYVSDTRLEIYRTEDL